MFLSVAALAQCQITDDTFVFADDADHKLWRQHRLIGRVHERSPRTLERAGTSNVIPRRRQRSFRDARRSNARTAVRQADLELRGRNLDPTNKAMLPP